MSGPLGSSQWMYASGAEAVTQQSLKFNDDESQYLSWTPASAGNRKTWTWSGWVKRGKISGSGYSVLFGAGGTTNNDQLLFRMTSDEGQLFWRQEASNVANAKQNSIALFRDPSAWYHIVMAYDSTNATEIDRIKIYVNGVRIELDNDNKIELDRETQTNNTVDHHIGYAPQVSDYFDGYMSDINFIDGQALDASSFGETVNGYWKAKDYAGTYGTNGFHLTFEDDVVSEGFNTATYRANAGTQSISGLGFSPDFVWTKARNNSFHHELYDTVRGSTKKLASSQTNAESTKADSLTSFDADGFTLGYQENSNYVAGNGGVAWCWDAGSGSPVSNTQGSITSTVKANPSYGFSIVGWAGTDGSSQTVGHGLNSTPELFIIKNRTTAGQSWLVYTTAIDGSLDFLTLENTGAKTDSGANAPTSSVFSVSGNSSNKSGSNHIAYCFHSVAGYSSIGSYSGTGSANNSVTGLGFKPAWLMIKKTNDTKDWCIYDSTRHPGASTDTRLEANDSSAEVSNSTIEITFDDDGFTLVGTGSTINQSGGEHIYMAFADTREAAFWKDVSGQGNHWTPNNLDYRDTLPDSPVNNWSVINSLVTRGDVTEKAVFSEGNLKVQGQTSGTASQAAQGTIQFPATGKYYFEVLILSSDSASAWHVGICSGYSNSGSASDSDVYYREDGQKRIDGTNSSYGATYTADDIIGIAVDIDGDEVEFFKNGASQGTISHALDGDFIPMLFVPPTADQAVVNFGQDSTFSGAKPMGEYTDDSELGTFQHQPPAGFKSLCTANLPDPSIISGTEYFNTVLYTGNGSTTQTITGVGFGSAPDFVWIKNRTSVLDHNIYDVIRGDGKKLKTNKTDAETDVGTDFTFETDGFFVGNRTETNENGSAIVGWNWKAGGTAVSNTAGSITSQVSANVDAGFSIVSYTGNTTTNTNFTVGHGLGTTPNLVIIKNRDWAAGVKAWQVWASPLGNNALGLDATNSQSSGDFTYSWNQQPDSSTFTVRADTSVSTTNRYRTNGRTDDYIAYCFANTDTTKAGSYTGNGSTSNSPFVYLGFQPSFFLVKRSDSGTHHWRLFDAVRSTFNDVDDYLTPSNSNAEAVGKDVDFVSNGVKIRTNDSDLNTSGGTYIFLAIASIPFKFSPAR